MPLKIYNPYTPSTRSLVSIDRSELWKGRPEKSLTSGKKRSSARNNYGRITTRHRGGGHKSLYRHVDFRRVTDGLIAEVLRVEHDPNRTAFIALIKYTDGNKSYIVAPNRIKVGDKVVSGDKVDINLGNCLQLKNIPVGTLVHNVELKPGKGGQLSRSAGSYAQLIGKDSGYVLLRLRSGEVRLVLSSCRATIGSVSNSDHQNTVVAKAGRSRWLGKRPTVRGVVMNPVDHPHGGGEGRTSGGRHPVSPKGKPAKGKRTRRNKSTDKFIVRRRFNK